MNRLLALVAAAVLAGCASTAPAPATTPWLDAQFQHDAALVTVTAQDLFRLDADLEQRLAEPNVREVFKDVRLRRVVDIIFGADRKGFAYRAGHSTVAADTWRDRAGDCLSLTVLTYAVAKKIGMSAVMQEVQTPAVFGRSGQLDVVNQHVNVLLPSARSDFLVSDPWGHDVVLDFEPDFATARRGTQLTEPAILARFYNNVAVEHMARGDARMAYAHFKAAILSDPGYVSPYGNLAVLYRRSGHEQEAESLLRFAVGLGGTSDVALHELHRLLRDQGRVGEAADVQRKLEARQAADPYYWMSRGLQQIAANEPRRAISSLQRAKDLAPTFAEVHRYLATAYIQSGDVQKAREEVALMENLGGPLNKVAVLRRKLDQAERPPQ
ncbi:tetratricopeptide repeat protein [Ramlibacter sp. PS4R-6]|uniref:tetratricopeptide repeat protein n=1 Tax=Ramlibacter sp. PS4R-6 TaxID=3133438 RepID=UPI0030B46BDA